MKSFSHAVVLAASLGSGAALAASAKMSVVSTGDCRDHTMLMNADALSKEIDGQVADGFMTQQQAREKLGPEATLSPEEIVRQLDVAKNLSYDLRLKEAEAQIRNALVQIRRLPPGAERWKLTIDGEILLAFVLGPMNRTTQAEDAFRRVLRLAPAHKIDPDVFPPSTMSRFERLRKEVTQGSKLKLTVKSSPASADVFLDGLLVGKTPFTGTYFPGEYQVELRRGDLTSLQHLVSLTENTTTVIDLGFEGAIHPNRLPCVASTAGDNGLSYATKLGTVLDVESVAVVRLTRSAGQAWLSATVLEIPSGQKLREGALKLVDPTRPPDGLAQLATFALTGKSQGQVVAGPPPALPAVSAKAAPRVERPLGVSAEPEGPQRTWRSTVAYGLAGAGLVAAGAGAFFTSQYATHDRALRERYSASGFASADSAAIVQQQNQRLNSAGAATVSFLGAAAALGLGGYLFFTDEPVEPKRSATVLVGPGGAQVQVIFP